MEIVTVANAQGELLEKNLLNTVSLDTNTGSVTIQGRRVIARKDGKDITIDNNAGFNIQPAGAIMPSNPVLTAEETALIMEAKAAFLEVVTTVLEGKKEVVKNEENN